MEGAPQLSMVPSKITGFQFSPTFTRKLGYHSLHIDGFSMYQKRYFGRTLWSTFEASYHDDDGDATQHFQWSTRGQGSKETSGALDVLYRV